MTQNKTSKSAQFWHVQQGPSSFGPLSSEEVESLIARGVVTESTLLSSDGMNWSAAGKAFVLPTQQPAQSAADQWHLISHDGNQYGPVPYSELEGWCRSGALTPMCLVRKEGDSQWRRVGELFPQPGPTTTQPYPAGNQAPVSLPQHVPFGTTRSSKNKSDGSEPALVIFGVLAAIVAVAVAIPVLGAARGFLGPAGIFIAFMVFRGLAALGRK